MWGLLSHGQTAKSLEQAHSLFVAGRMPILPREMLASTTPLECQGNAEPLLPVPNPKLWIKNFGVNFRKVSLVLLLENKKHSRCTCGWLREHLVHAAQRCCVLGVL